MDFGLQLHSGFYALKIIDKIIIENYVCVNLAVDDVQVILLVDID